MDTIWVTRKQFNLKALKQQILAHDVEEAKQAREVISNEEAALKAEEAAAKQWLDDICKSLDHMDKTYSKYNEFNVVVQQMINDTRYPSNKLLIDLQYRLLIFLPILGYRIVFSWETGRQ